MPYKKYSNPGGDWNPGRGDNPCVQQLTSVLVSSIRLDLFGLQNSSHFPALGAFFCLNKGQEVGNFLKKFLGGWFDIYVCNIFIYIYIFNIFFFILEIGEDELVLTK